MLFAKCLLIGAGVAMFVIAAAILAVRLGQTPKTSTYYPQE